MKDKISATIEDYLITLFILERDGEPVTGVRLADLLSVTSPTVTNTLKRMARDGLVSAVPSHNPRLTPRGLEAAAAVMRRHMLAEWMLDGLLPWSQLHQEAHEFEHGMSAELEAALLKKLDYPSVCPHGNPFPGHEDTVLGWTPISEVPAGETGVIRRIHEFAENNRELISYLEEKHIVAGQRVEVKPAPLFSDTVTLQVGDEQVPLARSIARYIYVEVKE